MKNWTTSEIIELMAKDIISWKVKEDIGRVRAAKRLTKQSGRYCSQGTMQTVFIKLGLNKKRKKRKTKKIPIEDQSKIPIEDVSDIHQDIPIEDLISSRIKSAKRKKIKSNSVHNKILNLPTKPTGIIVFGDPHVDNEGCDWDTLIEHITLVQSTEGILAACVGDMQDNWVGRLARCYADTSITASDGWRLSEWFLSSMQWVAIVGGNHDAWSHSAGLDPMKWLTQKCGVLCYAQDEIRITLNWKDNPHLEPVVWILRHDFSGRSWFHPTHGPHKEAMLDGRCNILTAGHIHQWGQLTTEQRHSRVTHAVRVRGYKRADSYAKQKGFFEQNFGEAVLIVINPKETGAGRITFHWNIKEGCQYLKFLRIKEKEEDEKSSQKD